MANDVNPQMQIRVSLKNFEYDSLLTEVLVGPWRLRETHYRSTKGYLAFDSSASNHLSGQKVVVFRRVLDKGRIAWLLVSLSLISPALGTLVGILSKRADVGVAVAAGIFALASFVQGLAAWFSG